MTVPYFCWSEKNTIVVLSSCSGLKKSIKAVPQGSKKVVLNFSSLYMNPRGYNAI